ncbi:MAG: TraR/DksA C4-type zinc finger protein [Alphaproteobacteria bacterium]|nr:TraR/DksA C4-type zinc finger protein [Alphaproteobacteria bacterium]
MTADPLTDAERDDLADTLRALEQTLQAHVQDDGRASVVDLDQAAVGRVSRVDALQAQQMAQAEQRRAETRLLQVRRALASLADDTYGDCRRCEEPIGYKRLAARPETPFCVACARALGA